MKYKDQLKIAISLGYKNVTRAINHIGKEKFKIKCNQNNERILMIGISNKHWIYRDGRVYSDWFGGRFIKPNPVKINDNEIHYQVLVGNKKRHYISRLIMFYFGEHNYYKIEEMPRVFFINNKTNDYNIKNLTFNIDLKEYSPKINIQKIVDNNYNRENISRLLKNGLSYSKIALDYNCSDMSVHRFIKRNNINVSNK